MMNDTVMANPSQPQAFMSSSNLVDITQKRVLDRFQARIPIGLIIY